jgi:hypothetical protein
MALNPFVSLIDLPYFASAQLEDQARVLASGKGLSPNYTFYLAAPNLSCALANGCCRFCLMALNPFVSLIDLFDEP